jgi:hypothetical protein
VPPEQTKLDVSCANPQCRIADTGKCIEGLDLTKCPHFGKATLQADASTEQAAVVLPSAERLKIERAVRLMGSAQVDVFPIVGAPDAGKTSLVASIFDLFQQGPARNLQFRRSSSLFGFEQACHHSRIASQKGTPAAERTPIGDFGFYHLGVWDETSGQANDLLIGDRSGEEYKSVADNPSTAGVLVEIKRADVITVLIDGARLISLESRHNARSMPQMILQGLIDGGVLGDQPLALVLTKLDEIQVSDNSERVQKDFDALVETVKRLFGTQFRDVVSFRIAASPISDVLPRGYGVLELLNYWINHPRAVGDVDKTKTVPARAFARITELNE